MSITDSAVGAMLEIPPQLFTKIEAAERAIQRLGKTSWSTANSVKTHWSEIATQGLGAFIQKIEEANKALGSLGGKNINVNMSGLEQAMTQAANTAQTESQKISESISKLAYSDVQFSSITELSGLVKSWKLTYKELEQALKDFNAQRLNQQVDSEEAQAINNKIQLLREYIRIKTMSESRLQTATIAMRDTTELEYRIGQVNKQLQLEAQRLTDVKVKADEAKQKLSEFMAANQGFSLTDAYSQRTKLESKLATLDIARTQASDNDKPFYEQKFNATKQAIEELQKKIETFKALTAQSDVNLQTQQSQQNVTLWTDKLRQLEEELRKVQSANASINAEINKGSTVKSLASEYANLTKRLQEVNNAMANYLSAGGSTTNTSYQKMETEYLALIQRRKEIEQMDIAEINRYRQQMAQQYYQGELSAFVQNEAQKKAVAQQTLNEQIAKAKEAGALYAQSYAGAMSQAEKILGGKSTGKLAVNLENIKRVLADLKTASGRLNLLNPADVKNAEKLKGKISELEALLKKYKDAATPNKPVINPQDAINAAKSAVSLKQLEEAYKKLKEARENTATSDPQWAQMNAQAKATKQQIDDIKKKMGELKEQTKKMSDSMGQLQQRIAAAFSLGAITGFIKKMVKTRAQFELQRIALGAIIQDADKANRIFTEVQQMALQSPFTIMGLENAAKQMAAFGFEAEKLVQNVKMVADLGAGLGVELDRIILVMGHLKARNYLEGTMVRQFTNMGFNVLGELAKYYTELEGKMISVADVQTRVKKKMVEFGDVEAVLKRVTSAGGMFYDMQKKQSESIWGQMQRITDAYDLMLNEIGKDNQGVISSMLTIIRQLISHWRMLVPIIKTAGAVMGTVFAVKGINFAIASLTKFGAVLINIRKGWMAAKTAAETAKAAWATTGLGALITGAALLTSYFVGAHDEAKALNDELDRLAIEQHDSSANLIDRYKELADIIKSTTASYKDRTDAMEEMKRTYSEILPKEMREVEYLKSVADGYEDATQMIRLYNAEKFKKNAESAIQKDYEEQIAKIRQSYASMLSDYMDFDSLGDTQTHFESKVKGFFDVLVEQVKQGKLAVEDFDNALQKMLSDYYGKDISSDYAYIFNTSAWAHSITSIGGLLDKDASDVEHALGRMGEAMDRVKQKMFELSEFESKEDERNFAIYQASYDSLRESLDQYAKALENVRAAKASGDEALYNQAQKELQAIIDKLNNSFSGCNETVKQSVAAVLDFNKSIKAAEGHAYDLNDQINEVSGTLLTFMGLLFNDYKSAKGENIFQGIGSQITQIAGGFKKSELQTNLEGIIRSVEEMDNIDLSGFRWAIIDSSTTVSDAKQSVKNSLDELKKSLASYQSSIAAKVFPAIAQALFLDGKTVEEVEAQIKSLETLWKKLGGSEKERQSGHGKDLVLKQWEDRLDALKRYYDAAEKAREHFNEGKTSDVQEKSFEKLWSTLELNDIEGLSLDALIAQGFNPEKLKDQYVAALKELLKYVPENYEDLRNKIQETIASESIEIDFKLKEGEEAQLKKELDAMFDNYELSKTFKGLGMPIDLTYAVGGKPTTLKDIRSEIARLRAEGGDSKDAENRIKILEEYEKKATEIEHKNQIERIKNYNKYLLESMGERVQIELKAIQDINKIRDDETLDQFSKEQAVNNRRKKMYDELAKFDFDKLKGSDIYIQAFKDIEKASKEQLQYVINKIKELQSVNENLSPSQVKALANELKKAEEALGKKTAITDIAANLKDAIKYARQRNELLREQAILQTQVDSITVKLSDAQKTLYDLELKRKSIADTTSDEWKQANEEVLRQQAIVKVLLSSLEQYNKIQDENAKKINKGEQAWKNVQGAISATRDNIKQIADAVGAVFDGLDSMGLVSDAFRDTYESISDILSGVDKTLAGLESIDISKPFSIITGGLKTIGGVFSTIGGFFGLGDKKKERQIKSLQDKVEDLDKAYQKLEKSIEDAFTFDQYNAGYNQMMSNLERQKNAYQEMISLEEAKKKSDAEKVKEYKAKLEELEELEKELRKSRIEAMGSTTDYMSEAENFVSAWLDAYKETGDGLDALKDNWDEFIENLFTKQAAAQIVSSRLKGVIDMINSAIDSGATDFDLADAVNKAREEWAKEAEIIEPILEQLFGSYGLGKGNGEFILSDLQKGIQNITEPQAAAIEAYLNSMRFAVFKHTEQLDTLIATIQAQYGGGENPILAEIKGIRIVLDSIDRRLGSVIDSSGGRGNYLRIK